MSTDHKSIVDRTSEQLDVQLLDALAQVEALLRHGREIQRAALAVRGVPVPISAAQRRQAGTAVSEHIAEMKQECAGLVSVLEDLTRTSVELNRLLVAEPRQSESSR